VKCGGFLNSYLPRVLVPSANQCLTILYTTRDNTQQYLTILQYLTKQDCNVMYCPQYCNIPIQAAILRFDIVKYCCILQCVVNYVSVQNTILSLLCIQMLSIIMYCCFYQYNTVGCCYVLSYFVQYVYNTW
jgi:hypothetical protein